MRFVILRLLQHNELGMFHSYRRLGKERAKQRAINFDGDVVDRVFPAAKDSDRILMDLQYECDAGVAWKGHWLKRQEKNWRLEGNCPKDSCYDFVDPGCLFAMVVDSGSSPAVGAWAVYPGDHQVARSILASGESCSLTNHSMIALHETEACSTLAQLSHSKPLLFVAKEPDVVRAKEPEPVPADSRKGVHLPPNPKRLVRILASVGHTLPSAVADIVDNSISKDATEIEIQFGRPDEGHGRWMAIRDNGIGMDPTRLAEAMRIGSNTEYDSGDLGKYGYGLKGASWSQTNRFIVVSRVDGKAAAHLIWDADTMESWHAQDGPLEPWIGEATRLSGRGTCVFWENMRPPKAVPVARGTDPHTSEVMELHRHLGLVFHRFLEGKAQGRKKVTLRINGMPVEPNDPIGHPKVQAYDRKTIRVPTATKDAFVHVQAFLLPTEAEIRAFRGENPDAIRKDLDRIGMYGRRNESQGVYVYRNQRLIQWGGWHQMWATADEKTKLARVTIDFGTDLDDQFAVNISKQKVSLSQQLQEETKKLAEIARKDSKRKYLDQDRPGRPKPSEPSKPDTPRTGGDGKPAATGATPIAVPTGSTTAPEVRAGKDRPSPVRQVQTTAFIWKIGTSMTGSTELQINTEETDLNKVTLALSRDPEALSSLRSFLQRLDKAGVQKILLDAKQK